MQCLKRLKHLLQFNYIILFFFIMYVLCFTCFYKNSVIDSNYICGRIIYYQVKNNKISIVIKSKKKLLGNYYHKNIKELNHIKYGNYICFRGEEADIYNSTIPNNFSYKKYLKSKRIDKVYQINSFKITKTNNFLYKLKNSIYKRANNMKSKEYIFALLLGNKNYLMEEDYNSLKNNGILHLFAVSGLHISFFIIFIEKLFNKSKWYIRDLIVLCFCLFYAFIVSFPASILRVFWTLLIRYVSKTLKININSINSLLIALIILLLYNPFYIYDLGFIYSFTLMFFILKYKITGNNYLTKTFKMSLLTFLVSMPITVYNFYQINILSIAINVIMIPLITYVYFPLSFITFLIPCLDSILSCFFKLFFDLSQFFNKINVFNIVIAKPPLYLVIVYYLCLIIFLKYKRLIYLLVSIFLLLINNYNNFSQKIIFFDVKQGDSSIIINKFNKDVMLIDTGGIVSFNSNNTYNISNNIINYLKSLGINKITTIIITHGDYDHMGEAINLVNSFKVEKVIFNCGEFNDLEKTLIKILDKKKIKYYSCVKQLNIDNYKLDFLQTKEYDNENDNSNVIYTELNGYKFMFMGDAGIEKEKDILEKYNISDIYVLKVGHHGSKTSSGKEFINKINPRYSIISVGKNNRYGHPNREVLNILENTKIYRTDHDGSIVFKIKNNKLKIETCSP